MNQILPGDSKAQRRGPDPGGPAAHAGPGAGEDFALGVSPAYRARAINLDPTQDPVAAQFVPQAQEARILAYETPDPLGDASWEASPRLIHHYRDRVLLLVTDRCATYCRHCFRRHFVGRKGGVISPQELEQASAWLEAHREVEEVLLTGGDPLVLAPAGLDGILRRLRQSRPDLILRLSTRIPLMQPERLDPAMVAVLRAHQPLWCMLHVNHLQELGPEADAALARLVDAGVPILAQTVLLRRVNDSVAALEDLFRGLLRRRIKPYYLFQGDLAAGTSHFRVALSRGLRIFEELRRRLSGMGMPTYAVDLPDGGGKVPVASPWYLGLKAGWHEFRTLDGRRGRYPEEVEESLPDLVGADRLNRPKV